jgi:hypothetical protein
MICCGRSAPSRRREASGMIEMRRAQLSFGGGLIDCGRIRIKNLSDALIRDQPACHGCLRLGTSTRHLGTSMPSRGRPPHHSPICRFPLRFRHDGRGCIKHPETAFRGAILMVRVNDLVYPSMDRAPHKMRLARGGRWVKTASPWLCGGRWRVFRQGRSPPPPAALFLGGIPPPSTVTRGDFRPLEPSAHRQGIQKDRRLRRTHSAWPDEHVHGHRTRGSAKSYRRYCARAPRGLQPCDETKTVSRVISRKGRCRAR